MELSISTSRPFLWISIQVGRTVSLSLCIAECRLSQSYQSDSSYWPKKGHGACRTRPLTMKTSIWTIYLLEHWWLKGEETEDEMMSRIYKCSGLVLLIVVVIINYDSEHPRWMYSIFLVGIKSLLASQPAFPMNHTPDWPTLVWKPREDWTWTFISFHAADYIWAHTCIHFKFPTTT